MFRVGFLAVGYKAEVGTSFWAEIGFGTKNKSADPVEPFAHCQEAFESFDFLYRGFGLQAVCIRNGELSLYRRTPCKRKRGKAGQI